MGLRSLRAICPNCGAKIHTQPKGLGHITWANSWLFAQTGTECPYCHVALTGKVTAAGRAELADGPQTTAAGFVKTRSWTEPEPQRYRVTSPDGTKMVFTSLTEATAYKAKVGGHLSPL